ncbi:Cyanovirin-N [Penicillium italicum]|uniref:Cyanovirin-N n=1 Tax=Penicillium italicum TaxID=40296 RepID=A0A0A2L4H9_PENIT|nr:Cyanovirin-N [Penicillium italicum]
MGFHRSSKGIDIKDKHILTAYCQRPSGESSYSELDLNEFIGANKGKNNPNCLFHSQEAFPFKVGIVPSTITKINIYHSNLGLLAWGSHGFSKISRDVGFKLEGPDNDPMLHAQLDDGEGNIRESKLNLGDCIKNENGHLRFMECF